MPAPCTHPPPVCTWVQEAAPAGFRGWEARVTGVERQREDGLHVFVEFEVRLWQLAEGRGGHCRNRARLCDQQGRPARRAALSAAVRLPTRPPGNRPAPPPARWLPQDASQYHFPVDELRRWIAGGVGASRKAAPPSPAKSGRGAAAGSVRSPAKSPAKSPVKSPVKAAAAANRSPAKPARAQQQDEQGTAAVTQQEEEEAPAPPKSARRSARKPAATSSRTAATPSRRRTAAAARTLAATEEEGEQQQQEQAAAAGAAAGTPASKAAAQEGGGDAAAERPSSARQRAGGKRKHSAVGTTDSGPGKRREAEGGAAVAVDQEPGWVGA